MKIFYELNETHDLSLALGFFDGVHLAHRKLIAKAVKSAQDNGLKSAVITFVKNPLCNLSNFEVSYLLSNEDKCNIIQSLGVDYIYLLDFSKFYNLSAKDYLKNVLVQHFSPKFITTGFNHHFGKCQGGDSIFLEQNQEKFGYTYNKIAPVTLDGHFISSTNIKDFLANSEIEIANSLLGRKFSVKNEVTAGDKIGRTIGFPTINLKWQKDIFKLPYGTYEGVCLNKKCLINWGFRPSVKGKNELLEAHLLDFSGDLYGQTIEISFVKKLRDEICFNSLDELKAQITIDKNIVQNGA